MVTGPPDVAARCLRRLVLSGDLFDDDIRALPEICKSAHGLGLSSEETAFCDALAENESARQAMQSDTLRLMARELTEMVKNMPKLDWTQRESVRASLRRNVRRLLASTATRWTWRKGRRNSSCDRRSCRRRTRSSRRAWLGGVSTYSKVAESINQRTKGSEKSNAFGAAQQ